MKWWLYRCNHREHSGITLIDKELTQKSKDPTGWSHVLGELGRNKLRYVLLLLLLPKEDDREHPRRSESEMGMTYKGARARRVSLPGKTYPVPWRISGKSCVCPACHMTLQPPRILIVALRDRRTCCSGRPFVKSVVILLNSLYYERKLVSIA